MSNLSNDEIVNLIKENISGLSVLREESMKRHCTFKIGGDADIYVEPDEEQLTALVKLLSENGIDFTILGNGSNVLISDRGIRSVTIVIGHNMSRIVCEKETVTAQAGALLSTVAATAFQNSLTGMEQIAAIPGSVGGAVLMNAGAYGGEVKDVLKCAKVLLLNGDIITMTNEDLQLSYRHSKLMETGGIVLEAVFELKKGEKSKIQSAMRDYNQRRRDKQPLEYPSAGSTFKRPEGYFAGKLIMDSGLQGASVGGAQVSEKHCGFVINRGGATADDVVTLMDNVISCVQEKFQVTLEPEVRKVGDFK